MICTEVMLSWVNRTGCFMPAASLKVVPREARPHVPASLVTTSVDGILSIIRISFVSVVPLVLGELERVVCS
jgi:hypothetical protein